MDASPKHEGGIRRAVAVVRGIENEVQDFARLASRYLNLLLRAERSAAVDLILRAADDLPLEDLYTGVLQEAQYELGRLWERNEVTVAQEHYCTAVTQLVLSLLYPRVTATPKTDPTFVGVCAEGELHEVGTRMVCDVFELRGWRSFYLGSSLTSRELIDFVSSHRADVIGISASRDERVEGVQAVIRQLRDTNPRLRILVGGRSFAAEPELWRRVGAHGTARDAGTAVDAAHRLLLVGSDT